MIRFWLARLRGPMTLERRARWLQQAARGVLDGLGIHYKVDGQPPTSGLVVANHLSYLDILLIGAAMPCFFVAKKEIAGWPFFGQAARSGGTIFIDRSSLASANAVARQIGERLNLQAPVLFFPEGTSSDGSGLLRFHSRLFDPATKAGAPVTTASIRYVIDGGVPERELCWFGDDAFLPHIWKVLDVRGFSAWIRFGEPTIYADRRTAAEHTYTEIAAWRQTSAPALDRDN